MLTFKAKKDRSRYKDTSHWLDAVYRNNKEFIDNKLDLGEKINKKTAFKSLVLEQTRTLPDRMTDKELNNALNKIKSPQKALSKLNRREIFTTYKERAQANVSSFLRRKGMVRELKKKAGISSKEKFDESKLQWNAKDKVYEYGDVYIDISDSPKGIHVYKKVRMAQPI